MWLSHSSSDVSCLPMKGILDSYKNRVAKVYCRFLYIILWIRLYIKNIRIYGHIEAHTSWWLLSFDYSNSFFFCLVESIRWWISYGVLMFIVSHDVYVHIMYLCTPFEALYTMVYISFVEVYRWRCVIFEFMYKPIIRERDVCLRQRCFQWGFSGFCFS